MSSLTSKIAETRRFVERASDIKDRYEISISKLIDRIDDEDSLDYESFMESELNDTTKEYNVLRDLIRNDLYERLKNLDDTLSLTKSTESLTDDEVALADLRAEVEQLFGPPEPTQPDPSFGTPEPDQLDLHVMAHSFPTRPLAKI